MILCDNCVNKDICKYVCRCRDVNNYCKHAFENMEPFYDIQLIYNCKHFKSKDIEDEEDES